MEIFQYDKFKIKYLIRNSIIFIAHKINIKFSIYIHITLNQKYYLLFTVP